jgi:hypothetical protein
MVQIVRGFYGTNVHSKIVDFMWPRADPAQRRTRRKLEFPRPGGGTRDKTINVVLKSSKTVHKRGRATSLFARLRSAFSSTCAMFSRNKQVPRAKSEGCVKPADARKTCTSLTSSGHQQRFRVVDRGFREKTRDDLLMPPASRREGSSGSADQNLRRWPLVRGQSAAPRFALTPCASDAGYKNHTFPRFHRRSSRTNAQDGAKIDSSPEGQQHLIVH